MSANADASPDVATPPGSGGLLPFLLQGPTLPALAARLGAKLATWCDPIRFGEFVIVARHDHVLEVLHRDLDFLIAPVNEKRIVEVNGPFVLGMDRSATLVLERGALYQALAAVDLAPIRRSIEDEAARRVAAADDKIDVVDAYARPIAGSHRHRTVRHSRFGRAHVHGRCARDLRTRLSESDRRRGHSGSARCRAAALMEAWFKDEIARRRTSGDLGTDMMGALMAARAVDDEGVRRTLGGMLVGSIDTTASSVAKIVAMIARDRALAQRIAADVDDEARLAGWCREALRRWPHNPIVLRQAGGATRVGDKDIQQGDRIFAWTQAAMLDAEAFPDPHDTCVPIARPPPTCISVAVCIPARAGP